MKILVSVLVFVTTMTLSVNSLAEMNKEGVIDMNGLFPPPQSDLSLGQRPDKPELVSPSFFQKIGDSKVTLEWNAVANATAYHVQVAKDPNFKWLVTEKQNYKGTSLQVNDLEGGKHYYWRVSGQKPDNKPGHTQGVFASSMFATAGK